MECFCWSSLLNVSVGVVCGLLVSFLGSVLIQFVLLVVSVNSVCPPGCQCSFSLSSWLSVFIQFVLLVVSVNSVCPPGCQC